MPRIFMALRQEDRHPITEILRQTPDIPDNCQWGLFLRNHDELTLEMVTDEERDYMYQSYAADPQMRINVGIRRRLAPLMENSRRRIELLNSLLFSLPGTPVIYYGDEIGMGDNIYLGDRNGVRTPMQWTGDRNAGFSRADPARLFAPPIMDAVSGYQSINVEAQERLPFSLLNWMKRMIALRKQFKVFGRGTLEFLPSQNRKVLPYVRSYEGELVLCVANLSRSVQPVELNLSRFKGLSPTEMLGLTEFPRIGELPYFLTLGPYAFYWFRLQQAPAPITARLAPEAHASTPAESLPAFFMGVAWDTLLDGNVRTLIEREALTAFIQRQRWFGGKARSIRASRLIDWGLLRRGHQPLFLTVVEVEYADGDRERYFAPLAIASGAQIDAVSQSSPQSAVARVTGARKGLIIDAAADETFGAAILDAIDRATDIRMRRGIVRIQHTPSYASLRGSGLPAARRMPGEQSNTSIAFGYRLIAKLFRRIEQGPNPEVEIGEQLTTKTAFTRVPRVAASIVYEQTAETPGHIAVLQEFVPSQGDGWSHALDELRRYFEQVDSSAQTNPDWLAARRPLDLVGTPVPDEVCDVAGAYIDSAHLLGRRTAELHLALAQDTTSEAFSPQPFTRADVELIVATASAEARRDIDQLARSLDTVAPEIAEPGRMLIARLDDVLSHLQRAKESLDLTTAAIRIHGDYHLGQVLWSEGDYYLLDFEGEPARPLSARRQKQSPLKDVAGMMRSFNYAAYAALFARAANRPADIERLEPWARVWQLWTSAAFLRGYFEAAGDAPFLPVDPVQRGSLLDLFVLDKALYELHYELNSRPEWVRIPLRGILDLLRE
jgi:maltose alpha-D-glucosyltransferase/alpha-amylase